MRRCRGLPPIFLALLFLHPTLAQAERIFLRDGRVLRADEAELLPGGGILRVEEAGRQSHLPMDEVLAVFPEPGDHLSRPRPGTQRVRLWRISRWVPSGLGHPAARDGGAAAAGSRPAPGSPAAVYEGITERMVDGVRRQLEEALRPKR